MVRMWVSSAKCSSADLASWLCMSSTSRAFSLAGAPRISERVPVAEHNLACQLGKEVQPGGLLGEKAQLHV